MLTSGVGKLRFSGLCFREFMFRGLRPGVLGECSRHIDVTTGASHPSTQRRISKDVNPEI